MTLMKESEYKNLRTTLFRSFNEQAKGATKDPARYRGTSECAEACAALVTAIVDLERAAKDGLVEGMRLGNIK